MELPRNRWFFEENGKTWFKFGKYNGEALEDVLGQRDGVWYVKHVMLEKFEDLTPAMRAFLEEALETSGDPVASSPKRVALTVAPEDEARERLAALRAKAKAKLVQEKGKKVVEEAKEVLGKRKNESEW